MSTDRGGSDLDVFNDLKPQTPDGKPITEQARTLVGLQVPEGSLPPVPGSMSNSSGSGGSGSGGSGSGGSGSGGSGPSSTRSMPPPPPSQRPKRSGGAPPLPPPSRPAAKARITENTPVTPSAAEVSRSALSRSDEERGEDTNPGAPPESFPERKSDSGLGLDSWVTTQPPGVGGRISRPPSPQISNLPEAVASAAAPAAAGASNGDVGWDDDDDKTQIYDKDTQAAAQSLLQPAVPTLLGGRPPPPMSRPPGAILAPGATQPGSPFGGNFGTTGFGGNGFGTSSFASRTTAPPGGLLDGSFAMPVQAAPSRRLPWVLAVLGAAIVALLFFSMLPKKGGLTVTVAGGPGNRELAAVEVVVDNTVKCQTSPCELTLKSGTHYVEVRAAGYQATAKSAVAIVGGQTAVHNVQLIRAGTGIKVFGEGSGLTLLVDGKEFGPLPQELREMEPGEHVIQVAGGARYEVFTQRIVVDPDRMTPIGPIKLKVTKGLATIRAGQNAEDAEVTLKVGDSRRVLPALPVRLEVETDRSHILVAKKKGYAAFEEPITFEDGQAEKTIEITLTERPTEDPITRRQRPTSSAPASARAEEASEAAEPEPTGSATLNLTSTPPSNVLLDGKPLGTTPLRDISVEPGTHRVIFIHGADRKPKVVEAAPGSSQTVSVSF